MALDLLSPATETRNVHLFLLLLAYRLTKVMQIMPLYTIRAHDVSKAFLLRMSLEVWDPDIVLTENGKHFAAQFFRAVCVVN